MNLISCDNCATVLDKDKIFHHYDLYSKEDGGIDRDHWADYGNGYVRKISCPSCGEEIVIKN